MEGKKRIACLYRVSTKGQVEKDDIPMQKTSCREFINKQEGWQLVKEYSELGVSGFKKSAKQRDILQNVMRDAEKGLFDVLLVFMFDRLGRKEDETPFILEGFNKIGVETWSVKEGRQGFENHSDKLLNYLRFWQSAGESIKTSIRVDEKHQQMTKEGVYRGGKPPYGYHLVPSGQFNKKGKELYKLEIDNEESNIIKEIFCLAHDKLYGGNRIAKYLNDKKIPSRTGGNWNAGVISFMLRNPIYKGYFVYGKTTCKEGHIKQDKKDWVFSEKPNESLIIIDSETFDRLQEIREKRRPQNVKKEGDNIVRTPTKSPLLFVGMIKCGHCQSPLTTTYNYKTWVTKDGIEKRNVNAKYRCSGKALAKVECDGQTIYAQNKIEGIVLKQLKVYLQQLKEVDFTEQIKKYKKNNLSEDQKQIKKLQKENEKNYEELKILENEVTKSIQGKSKFNPELLAKLIESKEQDIEFTTKKINEIEQSNKKHDIEVYNMLQLQKIIAKWEEVFDKSDTDMKKIMLSHVINEIIVYKDKVQIIVKLIIKEFIRSIEDNKGDKETQNSGLWERSSGMHNRRSWENHYAEYTTYKDILEKVIEVCYNQAS